MRMLMMADACCAVCVRCAASNSSIFQEIVVPFSQKLVAQNAQNPKKVSQCQPIVGAPTANSTKSAVAAAPLPAVNAPAAAAAANGPAIANPAAAAGGRRLQQAAAPLAQGPVPVALAPVRQPCLLCASAPASLLCACMHAWTVLELDAARCLQAPGAGAAKQPVNYVGKSTFTTPAGITAANINSKVQCSK